MGIALRPACSEDAPDLALVHARAVQGLARKDYPQAVLDAWAPYPPDERRIEAFRQSHATETRVVAERDGTIVGFAVMVPKAAEFRACYVVPEAARQGIGRALAAEIESIARGKGLKSLSLIASLTAAPFYRALGYAEVERGTHYPNNGDVAMTGVKMRKTLY